jgi:uncharacterized protein (TIGR03000 family)
MHRFQRFSMPWLASLLVATMLVTAWLCLPGTAQAQGRVRTGGGSGTGTAQVRVRTVGGFGNFGGFGFGNFGGLGFGNWGGLGFGNFGRFGAFGYPWGYGWTPGFGAPFGAWAGMPYINPGWQNAAPYYPNAYGPENAIVMPGFAASDPVRVRTSLYPAIPEPSREVIQAALEGDSQARAKIELHVPTASAQVYLDGVLTKQTGLDRSFVTPRLNPAGRYAFAVEVSWRDASGQSRTIRRQLSVRAGETSSLNLRDPE